METAYARRKGLASFGCNSMPVFQVEVLSGSSRSDSWPSLWALCSCWNAPMAHYSQSHCGRRGSVSSFACDDHSRRESCGPSQIAQGGGARSRSLESCRPLPDHTLGNRVRTGVRIFHRGVSGYCSQGRLNLAAGLANAIPSFPFLNAGQILSFASPASSPGS